VLSMIDLTLLGKKLYAFTFTFNLSQVTAGKCCLLPPYKVTNIIDLNHSLDLITIMPIWFSSKGKQTQ